MSIEKIEYIKGGAASTLYGADAANGVIQIITKKGKPGEDKVFFEAKIGSIQGTDDYLKYDRTAEAIFEPDYQTNIGLASLVEVIKQLIIFQVLYIMTTPLMIWTNKLSVHLV